MPQKTHRALPPSTPQQKEVTLIRNKVNGGWQREGYQQSLWALGRTLPSSHSRKDPDIGVKPPAQCKVREEGAASWGMEETAAEHCAQLKAAPWIGHQPRGVGRGQRQAGCWDQGWETPEAEPEELLGILLPGNPLSKEDSGSSLSATTHGGGMRPDQHQAL